MDYRYRRCIDRGGFERRLGVLNRLLKGPKADFLWEQRSIGQGFIKDAIHQNHTNTGWILQWVFDALKCLLGNPFELEGCWKEHERIGSRLVNRQSSSERVGHPLLA